MGNWGGGVGGKNEKVVFPGNSWVPGGDLRIPGRTSFSTGLND